jgi:tRNA(Leu) C34 or U34 (ribose-2'-O)-methylase TrmL
VYIIAPQDCNSTLKIDGKVGLDFESLGEPNDGIVDVGNNVVLHRSNGIRVKGYTEAEVKARANHHLFAQKALEWLDVTEFNTTQECIDSLRRDGYQIWSTDLSQVAVTLDENGLGRGEQDDGDVCCSTNGTNTHKIIPDKLAIVFGTEAVGCSTQILEASDKRVYLPLRGFADSLNLSVATALVVHQLFLLDPTLIGAMSEEERVQLRRKWYAKLATQRIMTQSEKAKKRRLASQIKALEEIEHKANFPESYPFPLQQEQKDKLAKLPSIRKELEQFEDEVYTKALLAVEDLVLNPPEPIGDMRRHDDHRISYTGKNTKKRGGEAWSNMPATNYVKVEVDTASFFRDRVKEKSAQAMIN